MDNMNSNGYYNDPKTGNQEPGIFDILTMPVDKAVLELGRRGAKVVRDIKQNAAEVFQKIQDEEYAKICRPLLTMDDCLSWLKIQREIYPQAAHFFIFAVQNPTPRNENDLFSVTIAIVDAQKKTIPVTANKKTGLFSPSPKGQDIVCMVIPTKTLDTKLLKALNGGPSVLIKL